MIPVPSSARVWLACGGRYRPGGVSTGLVLFVAFSFTCRSAWRWIWVVSTDSCPSQSAMMVHLSACNAALPVRPKI